MAKRRTRPKPAPSAPPEPNPRRLSIDASASGGAETLRLFPHELQPGDIWRDEHGAEWRVAAAPHTYREGKRVGVRMVLVATPTVTSEHDWAAHERVEVRREG